MHKMYKRSMIFTALALGIACRCAPALANDIPASDATDRHVAPGIHEVADEELSTMRGRYVVGDNTVLWFGVEMISTWQTASGQTLQSTMTVGMNFSKNPNQPQVTFVPTVTITSLNDPPTTSVAQSSVSRSVQSGGVANVGGLTQSVQIAGDHNAASNVTSLNIQNAGSAPSTTGSNASSVANTSSSDTSNGTASPASASVTVTGPTVNVSSSTSNLASSNNSNSSNSNTNTIASTSTSPSTTPTSTTNTGTSTPTGRTAITGDATASSTYSNNSAQVNLAMTGEGSVSQWIHPGSLGQTIALTTDNAMVTNQMIVNLVTQSINATSQLVARNLSQSLNLSHISGH